jgi:hypothetical protein
MFRELLAWLIPRRRPGRSWAIQPTEVRTHEPLCNTMLSEVYHAHAAIHGANKLLPGETLPDPSQHLRTDVAGSQSSLA